MFFHSVQTVFGHGAMIVQEIPAGIHFLAFITTLQHGGTCTAHGIGPKCSSWALLGSSRAIFERSWDPLGQVLAPRDLRASSWEGLGTCRAGFSKLFGTSYIMFLWMSSLRICIYLSCSFTPSGAAVCAQHIHRLPKGEPSVPNDPASSS